MGHCVSYVVSMFSDLIEKKSLGANVKMELDSSNYVTKARLCFTIDQCVINICVNTAIWEICRFMRTLINKTYKYMTSVSKNVYIDTLDE